MFAQAQKQMASNWKCTLTIWRTRRARNKVLNWIPTYKFEVKEIHIFVLFKNIFTLPPLFRRWYW